VGRRLAVRLSSWIARGDLFERPGQRPRQAALQPLTPVMPLAAPSPASARASVAWPREGACHPAPAAAIGALLRGSGRLRVVNHWATWCEPCVEELPLLGELCRALGQRADFVGVSWDLFDEEGDPAEVALRVAGFADAAGVPYGSFLATEPPEAFFRELAIAWRQIPQTWLVDSSGQVVHRVEGALDAATAEDLGRRIEALR
jgi:thiol-disulfide isomerase/thioredoxin